MADVVRFRVAPGISAWHASDFGDKGYFESGRVHEVSGPAKLVATVRDAIDAGSLVKATKADLEEQTKADEAAAAAAAGEEG